MSDELTERDVEALAGDLLHAVTASDWYAERIAQARREGADEVAAKVQALPVHRIKVGWANCTEDMVSLADLRAALRGDA